MGLYEILHCKETVPVVILDAAETTDPVAPAISGFTSLLHTATVAFSTANKFYQRRYMNFPCNIFDFTT